MMPLLNEIVDALVLVREMGAIDLEDISNSIHKKVNKKRKLIFLSN